MDGQHTLHRPVKVVKRLLSDAVLFKNIVTAAALGYYYYYY